MHENLSKFRENNKAQSNQGSSLSYEKDGQIVTRNATIQKKQKKLKHMQSKPCKIISEQLLKMLSNYEERYQSRKYATEISIQIQEDLGYGISTQTLPSFHKAKHYVNYIEQVEAFKKQNNKAPLS